MINLIFLHSPHDQVRLHHPLCKRRHQSNRVLRNCISTRKKFISENAQYGELSTGDTTLSFAQKEFINSQLNGGFVESRTSTPPLGMEIAFATDNVQALYDAAIDAGAKGVKPAETKPWGQTVAYVRDLDGFLVEICTPIA